MLLYTVQVLYGTMICDRNIDKLRIAIDSSRSMSLSNKFITSSVFQEATDSFDTT